MLVAEPLCWGEPVALRSQTEQLAPNARPRYKYKSRSVPRPMDERVPLPASILPPEPLVSPELATAVAERLAHNKAAAARRNPDLDATLLRGELAVCGVCGHPLMIWRDVSRHPESGPRVRYHCRYGARTQQQGRRSHTIKASKLDAAVWAKIEGILRDPALIREEVERMRQQDELGDSPGASVLAAIDTQITDLTRRIRNKRAYAEHIHDEQERCELAEETDLLAKQRRGLERERLAAQAHYADWHRREEQMQGAVAWAERVAANLASVTQQEKREWLVALRARVAVYPKEQPGPEGKRIWLTVNLPVSGEVALHPGGSSAAQAAGAETPICASVQNGVP
jgi:hypothetical protein